MSSPFLKDFFAGILGCGPRAAGLRSLRAREFAAGARLMVEAECEVNSSRDHFLRPRPNAIPRLRLGRRYQRRRSREGVLGCTAA